MKQALAWVKDALAANDMLQYLTHYLVKDRFIFASNGRLLAAHPFPFDGTFLVPGAEFEKVLGAAKDPVLTLEGGIVHIKSGRFKGRIRTVDASTWPLETQPEALTDDQWNDPTDLPEALKRLRPFVSDNATQPWATCIGLHPGYGYATNNIVIARTKIPSATASVLLPSWAVDFVLSRAAGLNGWATTPEALWFSWENNAWLKAQAVIGDFPPQAAAILQKSGRPTHEITPGWKEAFNRVASLVSDGDLYLEAKQIAGISGESMNIEDEGDNPMPEGVERTVWDPKFLAPVIAVATHWNPAAWPSPAVFMGDKIGGVVLGRRPKGA